MNMVRLGRTDVLVPAVSLGTWGQGGPRMSGEASVGWSGNDDRESIRALITAWESGITHWDTADVYGGGHAEALIGSIWDRVPRQEIFVATKVGWDKGGFDHYYHPRMMRQHLERSLDKLRTDRIDLYYFHHCDFGTGGETFDDAIAVMRRFREEGKIRFIGLSDWKNSEILRYADRADPDVVQPYRNVVDDTWVSSGLADWVLRHDAGTAFFSPIKHGLLLGKYDQPVEFPPGDHRRRFEEFRDPSYLARMRRAAEAVRLRFHDRSEPVLHALLGALLTDAPGACVLLGQRTPRHVEAASHVGEPLSAEEAAWVKGVYSGQEAGVEIR